MLPQRQKVDISKLSLQEQKLFRLYGKLPSHKNVLTKMQKDRKYFDSGDYALSKAGKAPATDVGTAIPNPENIPHASTSGNTAVPQGLSISPTNSISKESSLSHVSESNDVEEESVAATSDDVTADSTGTQPDKNRKAGETSTEPANVQSDENPKAM